MIKANDGADGSRDRFGDKGGHGGDRAAALETEVAAAEAAAAAEHSVSTPGRL